MSWLARKLDTMAGAVAGAAGVVAMSQFPEFVHQYLQRLGGHMDEARRTFDWIRDGGGAATLEEAARRSMLTAAWDRLEDIQQAYAAIRHADFLMRPVALIRNLDREIAVSTLHDFQPAVPIDPESLVYAALGLLIGLLTWELAKLPATAAVTTVRRLRKKRSGALGRPR